MSVLRRAARYGPGPAGGGMPPATLTTLVPCRASSTSSWAGASRCCTRACGRTAGTSWRRWPGCTSCTSSPSGAGSTRTRSQVSVLRARGACRSGLVPATFPEGAGHRCHLTDSRGWGWPGSARGVLCVPVRLLSSGRLPTPLPCRPAMPCAGGGQGPGPVGREPVWTQPLGSACFVWKHLLALAALGWKQQERGGRP